MRILLIDDAIRARIAAIIEYAEANVIPIDEQLDVKNGELPPAGDNKAYRCIIPDGFRVIYTIEEHPQGKVRHLSMSVNVEGNCPSPEAVSMIMKEFGFKTRLAVAKVYLEDIGPNHKAVNVLEMI